jgi:hypothetical protein
MVRWHASPKGICEVVAKQLQEANAAVDIMRIDAVLHNSRTRRQSGYLGGIRKDFVMAMRDQM